VLDPVGLVRWSDTLPMLGDGESSKSNGGLTSDCHWDPPERQVCPLCVVDNSKLFDFEAPMRSVAHGRSPGKETAKGLAKKLPGKMKDSSPNTSTGSIPGDNMSPSGKSSIWRAASSTETASSL